MLYIIEGPDKCGKTTFVANQNINCWYEGLEDVRKRLNLEYDKICIHFDANDLDPVESLRYCAGLSHKLDVYMDRSWISEIVYGNVYRGGHKLSDSQLNAIRNIMDETPHIIYYFDMQLAENDSKDTYESNNRSIREEYDRYFKCLDRDIFTLYNVRGMPEPNSVGYNMNKYCKEQPCSICPCGKFEFPKCVDKLKELRDLEVNNEH